MNPLTRIRSRMPWFPCIVIASTMAMAFAGRPVKSAASNLQLSPDGDHREKIVSAFRALQESKSYRMRSECHLPDPHITSEAEYMRPDRYHSIGNNHESIRIGESTYVRRGDGRWKKYRSFTPGTTESDASEEPKGISEIMSRAKELKLIGQETLDGIPVLAYQVVQHNDSGSGLLATTKIWIGVKGGLPHRREIEYDLGPQPSKLKCIMTYFDFNARITIEPPPAESIDESTAQEPVPGIVVAVPVGVKRVEVGRPQELPVPPLPPPQLPPPGTPRLPAATEINSDLYYPNARVIMDSTDPRDREGRVVQLQVSAAPGDVAAWYIDKIKSQKNATMPGRIILKSERIIVVIDGAGNESRITLAYNKVR